MDDISRDADRRLEFSKALLARSQSSSNNDLRLSFCESSITFAFSCLEGMLSHVFDHFSLNEKIDIFDRSIMNEREIRLVKGKPVFKEPKFRSIEERVQFLIWRFSNADFDNNLEWWAGFLSAVSARNRIMHPKDAANLTVQETELAVASVIKAIDALVVTVFGKPWPKAKVGLNPLIEI